MSMLGRNVRNDGKQHCNNIDMIVMVATVPGAKCAKPVFF
jgi:hypothetical protein